MSPVMRLSWSLGQPVYLLGLIKEVPLSPVSRLQSN